MITQIYHKKNELFEVEFYKNEECTEAFDLTNAANLYIKLKDGDISPIIMQLLLFDGFNIFVPYIEKYMNIACKSGLFVQNTNYIKTLNDITPNLSKYIPEDNAVLFLSREDKKAYVQFFINHNNLLEDIETYKIALQIHNIDTPKSITIFLPHGTQSEIQKAEEVGKYLWENFGIKPNLCALHFFVEKKHIIKTLRPSRADRMYNNEIYGYEMQKICKNINKIITTNSTGILPVQDNERLQVIDGKEIFEEYLKTENN